MKPKCLVESEVFNADQKACMCGTRNTCLGDAAASNCDAEHNMCKCGTQPKCSGEQPFCFGNKCLCSSEIDKFCGGNSTLAGTCTKENHVCREDGACVGELQLSSIHALSSFSFLKQFDICLATFV